MKRFLFLIWFLFPFTFSSNGQINLVINPSIELQDTCITFFNQVPFATGWDTLRNGGGCTPDLYNECYSNSNQFCGVPVNWWTQNGFQYAKSGNGYAGFAALYSTPQTREYIQGTLVYKLIQDKSYCVKANINLSNFSKLSCNSLGFYIDDGLIYANWYYCDLPNVIPQITNFGQQFDDTLNWMKIEGIYNATGNEEFLTIGNFFPDSLSGIVLSNPSGSGMTAYYYIDDVSVIDANLPAFAGNDTVISNSNDSAFIGRQPEIGLNDDCIWFVNGLPIDTVAGLWVYPDTTTIYTLVQTICGNIDTDSVTVYVFPDGISDNNTEQNNYIIAPNPNNGNFSVSLIGNARYQGNVEIKIWDITGNVLRNCKLDFKNNKAILHTDLPDGMYIISVKDNNGNIYNPKKITIIK